MVWVQCFCSRVIVFFVAVTLLSGSVGNIARATGVNAATTIALSFAGDCTFGTVNGDDSSFRFPAVYSRSGKKDYPFALVKQFFLADDLNVVNFECTLTKTNQLANKQWHFKGDASYSTIFPSADIGAVTLANNHSFDYMQAGFSDTVANFKNANVPTFYQNVPYVTTVKGIQVVLIGDCTVVGENTTVIDGTPTRVLSEIKRYKRPDNVVIIFMHWGRELDTVPRLWQQLMGRAFIDAGADAVVGAHPHVLQGIEQYKGKYIAYSLGNFAFGGNSLARRPETAILQLRFVSAGGITRASGVSVVPCLITSSHQHNTSGALINDYQPTPVYGPEAAAVTSLLLARSSVLDYGLKSIAMESNNPVRQQNNKIE